MFLAAKPTRLLTYQTCGKGSCLLEAQSGELYDREHGRSRFEFGRMLRARSERSRGTSTGWKTSSEIAIVNLCVGNVRIVTYTLWRHRNLEYLMSVLPQNWCAAVPCGAKKFRTVSKYLMKSTSKLSNLLVLTGGYVYTIPDSSPQWTQSIYLEW